MSRTDRIRAKIDQIIATLKRSGQELGGAFHEEPAPSGGHMISIKRNTLDFDLIETDVRRLYRELKKDGANILGTYLMLKQEHDCVLVAVEIYNDRDSNTLRNIFESRVKGIRNIPPDVKNELMERGIVKLHLAID